MSEPKLLTKTELRDRGWSHGQIKNLETDGLVHKGNVGRPENGYKISKVTAAERARAAA